MYKLIATAAFGLESIVKREVEALGYKKLQCVDSKVEYETDDLYRAIVKSNLWLRSADRILLKMGSFSVTTFDELFEATKALPWDEWIPENGKFTVTAKSIKSNLYSVPDIQKIVKKAVVEKLKQKHNVTWFSENGPEYTIQAALLKDIATLTIDTTGQGQGLHKRGYRERATEAPMKETMAAGLISISRYKGLDAFLDPCCGSGTLPIEAAMIAKNIAPGLNRSFASEKWQQINKSIWKDERKIAYSKIKTDLNPIITGADIDPNAIALAKANAELAGVDDCINFVCRHVADTVLDAERGTAIINPPYGERLGAIQAAERFYGELGKVFNHTNWRVYVITPDEFFESAYKKTARAKRKLFNGMIKTDYYQYF